VTAAAVLGIDLGERRVGIALAAAGDLSARPLTTLPRGADADADAARLRPLVTHHRVEALVVGLPLEASGAPGPMAEAARAWAAAVGERLGLPVRLQDERLSSHLAEQRLGPMPRGRSGGPPSPVQRTRYRERVDREAAAIILQDHLDAARRAGSEERPR
jgi:putative Holliday junction resolvase